jgi:uncharacterized membrane protein YsdA (DUF1294 family)
MFLLYNFVGGWIGSFLAGMFFCVDFAKKKYDE